jgi:putative acetyltransferase
MIIRSERKDDYDTIYQLNVLAFENRLAEADLVDRIRKSQDFIPVLSIVAEVNGQVVGHILFSKIGIVSNNIIIPALALAPMAVLPNFQKQGIGARLVRDGLNKCRELGHNIVVVIGHPWFYPKFGFKSARKYGLECDQYNVSDDVFMVVELDERALQDVQGIVRYPEIFDGV